MIKERLENQREQSEDRISYTANLEGITFTGIEEYLWEGKTRRDVLCVEGFDFGIFGNKIICDRKQFSEKAQEIAEVKKELDGGNRHPLSKFIVDNFYVTKEDREE